MNILLSGGGTLGSVSTLLAVASALKKRGGEICFVGTRLGPERKLVMSRGIHYAYIVAPKFRRYVSLAHVLLPFQFIAGLVQSFVLLLMSRPGVIVSAGGYVSVPLVWIGWILRIPSVIHQQDVETGLASKLMKPFATRITVAFKDSLKDFNEKKTTWIGNPTRNLKSITNDLLLEEGVPTVLITGGGTGAQAINDLMSEELLQIAQVIHVTGEGKKGMDIRHPRYHKKEFLNDEMKEALAKATVVVSRAGLGTISELSKLGKASIIIPMPHTHQEKNAEMLQRHNAAIILEQEGLTKEVFASTIRELLRDRKYTRELEHNIKALSTEDANSLFVETILSVVK